MCVVDRYMLREIQVTHIIMDDVTHHMGIKGVFARSLKSFFFLKK